MNFITQCLKEMPSDQHIYINSIYKNYILNDLLLLLYNCKQFKDSVHNYNKYVSIILILELSDYRFIYQSWLKKIRQRCELRTPPLQYTAYT